MSNGPLSGIKIVEWAHVHFGPGAGMFLSDMGAEVIHVEPPEGDIMRHYASLWGNQFMLPHDRNCFTEDLLRNKKSLTVNLKHEEAREIVRKLADQADVFITNFRPEAGKKNGLDFETLSARNPRLIYAQGTSYGGAGPEKDSPGLEMMGLARGGLMLGSAVAGAEPVYPTMGLSDRLGSIGLLVSILSALLARERTGVAQYVETSLLGWTVNLQASAISCAANTGQAMRPLPRDQQDDPNYNYYRLGDGTWIALGMTIHPDYYWPLICRAIERPDLVEDERFLTQDLRRRHFADLIRVYDEVFSRMTWAEWEQQIRKYELISCRINSLLDLKDDEQILANGYLTKRPHPDLGEWWYAPIPIHFEKTPADVSAPAPSIGEHTDEVLRGLGYGQSDIQRLRSARIV